MQTVFINGRFLTQRMTGVQRYAREALIALDRRLSAGLEGADLRCVLLAPPGTASPPLSAIEFREVGHLRGHAWEQLSLARATRGELLFSFWATGPLLKTRQVVTIHDAALYAAPRAFSLRSRSWHKLLLGQLSPRVPLVLTVSDFSKRELTRHFGCTADKVRVTPCLAAFPATAMFAASSHSNGCMLPSGVVSERSSARERRLVVREWPTEREGIMKLALRAVRKLNTTALVCTTALAAACSGVEETSAETDRLADLVGGPSPRRTGGRRYRQGGSD
jgi:hypothetical protein